MITPAYLKQGDKIGVVAPARKMTKEELDPAMKIMQDWGFELVTGKNIFNEEHQFSGTDEERSADMQQMLDDASIKAIIAARGGYGTMRIIDGIDFTKFLDSPKWIVGYSDITVLHAHVHKNFGVETIHATMPINFLKNEEALESLRKALFGENLTYREEHKYSSIQRTGNCEGILIGGNLSLLFALTGSRSDMNTEGKILFIEDLDEYLYHIDRMMLNLKRSGKLSNLAGLIVGGMTDMKDNTIAFGKTAEEIIMDNVKEYNYPVCFGFPAGHVEKNKALILGRKVELEVGEIISLNFLRHK